MVFLQKKQKNAASFIKNIKCGHRFNAHANIVYIQNNNKNKINVYSLIITRTKNPFFTIKTT